MSIIFGEPWDAPVCEEADVAGTPVGTPCLGCSVPIQVGDQGLLIPLATIEGQASLQPWHRMCFLRSVVGPALLPLVHE
ncbi:hypothetical protein E6R60_26230 [Streptomyces sp. A0642]|uniref:hypothetical protein n=1 Tax=Streptomyces sp. A0642 TaxID=2563100 RepID=UPI0010A24071|nr:hypothetical protein [Streptomyces sp. A0642]THA72434.1 hypothetical protein E6R60_26230 [Streptomyces sp. A0642]